MSINNGERKHSCSVCEKGFATGSRLEKHMTIHTVEWQHGCSVCGKGFVTISHLTNHMKYYTGDRPHSCSVCGKGFVTSSKLTLHEDLHGRAAIPVQRVWKGLSYRLLSQTVHSVSQVRVAVFVERYFSPDLKSGCT
ncbi:hypothetical protein DPMN_040688 [Dreissena polymorpha]|uniref:C2H2-type domain-containing protein n=1 Tax=Dreissena polymorpha TaxID=45954 RepID=A0A9D4CX74_DREPO|nr:hypothetical protein DPMN_040688 [Dreissena polymorpha]